MKHFVLGNGESRRQIDLNKLKSTGKIYGCNALYRDFEADAIVAVDGGMMFELYAKGYALNHLCYFRSWTKLPEDAYEMFAGTNLFEGWHETMKSENEKGSRTQFVMNGTDPNNMLRLANIITEEYRKQGKTYTIDDVRQRLGNHHQWITWVEDQDQVQIIPEEYSGWSAGPIAVRMMLEDHKPDEVFLIGFDLGSYDGRINNVYKGTRNYVAQDSEETTSINWKRQHIQNFQAFPDVTFYKVNPKVLGEDALSEEIEEWKDFDNVDYLSFEELEIKLDKRVRL